MYTFRRAWRDPGDLNYLVCRVQETKYTRQTLAPDILTSPSSGLSGHRGCFVVWFNHSPLNGVPTMEGMRVPTRTSFLRVD